MAKVKNVAGTSTLSCNCGTWLKHWEKYSGSKAYYCSCTTCLSTDLVGAHVLRVGSFDFSRYIVPLCRAHNASVHEIEISDSIRLVKADRGSTCGY